MRFCHAAVAGPVESGRRLGDVAHTHALGEGASPVVVRRVVHDDDFVAWVTLNRQRGQASFEILGSIASADDRGDRQGIRLRAFCRPGARHELAPDRGAERRRQ